MKSISEKIRLPRLLAWGTAIVLIGGGVAAYGVVWQRQRLVAEGKTMAQLVPDDVVMAASISTDEAQWQQLRQYGISESQAHLGKPLAQWQQLLADNGYSYTKDIEPGVGDRVTIAYLESGKQKQQQASQLPQPDLIILPMENPTQARQLLEGAKSRKGRQIFNKVYKGVTIRETGRESKTQPLSAAVIGRFLVVTSSSQAMEQVIDTSKGVDSLARMPGYTEALSKIHASKPLAQVYANVPILAANASNPLVQEILTAGQQRQGMATTVTLEPEGLRFQVVSWLKPDSTQAYEVTNTGSSLAERLPDKTLLMLSGDNFTEWLQGSVQGNSSTTLFPMAWNNLSSGLQMTLGLDLQQDLLPWMEGEFAVALIPAPEEVLASAEAQASTIPLGAGMVIMVKSSDRTRTELVREHLNYVMLNHGAVVVEASEPENPRRVSWEIPDTGLTVSHGWLEEDVAFMTLGAPILEVIASKPSTPLIQTTLFQKTVPPQPNPDDGQFFLDVERTINRGVFNLPELPPTLKALAPGVRSVGMTRAIRDEHSTRFDIIVQLKPR